MDTDQIRELVIKIIGRVAPDEDLSNLSDTVSLRDQLGLDSMDLVDIVLELRKEHRIEIPADDYGQLMTMQSFVQYLQPKFNNLPD